MDCHEFWVRIWKKRFLSSKINFKKNKLKKIKKIFCKTILLAVRRQSVKNIMQTIE